jgi:hypothetical protein
MRLGQDTTAPDYVAPGAASVTSDAPVQVAAAVAGQDTRPWYTRVRDWLADSAIVNAATDVRDYTVAETQKAINDLYQAGLTFQSTLSELKTLGSDAQQDPDLAQQYSDLVSRGNVINDTIIKAVNGIAGVVSWVKQNVGQDVTSPGALQGLGFVELVPYAIIGAAVAATALAIAWITDARTQIDKINAFKSAGLNPQQIADAMKQSGGVSGAFSSATGLVFIIGIVAAGIYFAPELKKLVGGRS